jgi:hypothetical protein
MPSARELLEQADALMRRNRSPLMDDIPVLTDSVPEARPGHPAAVRPRLPGSRADTIPMLTERISSAPASASLAPAAPAVTPKAGVVEEGEPSDWLQLGGAEPSVIGEAPDSIAMVPPYVEEEEIEVEAPPEVEESFDAELAQRQSEAAPQSPSPEPPVPVPHPPARVAEIEAPAPVLMAEWELDTIIDERHEDELASAETEWPVQRPAASVEEPAAIENVVDAGPSPEERQAAEEARWASMAEEIRMQVLQRIDLFTDTGLRDQLGARLQPIVDRASADLVATINQHVGDLLRAYVSEAIEREIESWRRNAKTSDG